MKLHRGRFLETYTIRGRAKIGKLCFYHSFGARFRQTRFFILRNENMRVPRPGDCAKNSKSKNVGFWLSPLFRIVYILIGAIPRWGSIYLYSRYTAMAAYYVNSRTAQASFRGGFCRPASHRPAFTAASLTFTKFHSKLDDYTSLLLSLSYVSSAELKLARGH